MTADAPFRVLVTGGGPAALEAVLALRDLAPDLDVDVLAPETHHVYRPLSTLEPFGRAPVRRYPLARLAELGVTVHRDALMRVEPHRRTVVTDHGDDHPYDALLVATGAQHRHAVPRVLTFEGPGSVSAMRRLLEDVVSGAVASVAFVAPPGTTWTLPLYELALQTAERAQAAGATGVRLSVVSHERRPLAVFGDAASMLLERLLEEADVAYVPSVRPPSAERVVALPVPACGPVPGLPADEHGFLPVDDLGRVRGVPAVWAAGDGTTLPVKQGGLATQQAEVAARAIAASAGAPVEVRRFEPVLRALLVTGHGTWYLRRPLAGDAPATVSKRPLWDPPGKLAGRRLGPYLARLDPEPAAASPVP